jgi:phage FluMu protein Com
MVIDGEFFRCEYCDKLLAEKAGAGTVIVCNRCKTRNSLGMDNKEVEYECEQQSNSRRKDNLSYM